MAKEKVSAFSTKQYYGMYGNTALHTNYNYFRGNLLLKNTEEVLKQLSNSAGALDKLEAQERRFYEKFGVSTYKDFIELLRNLMNSKDGQLLRKASNKEVQNLISTILANKAGAADLNNIELSIVVKTEDAANKLKQAFSGIEGMTTSGDFNFAITGNIRNMKLLANRLKSKRFHVFTGDKKTGSLNDKALTTFLQTEGGLDDMVEFSVGGSKKTSWEVSELIKPRPFPWGYTKTELTEMVRTDPQTWLPKLTDAILAIKKEIESYFSGGSPEFQRALKQTLDSVLGSEGWNLFFIGANIRAGLLGAFGEFGTALLINYVYNLTGNTVGAKEAEIIGYSNGKQDVLFDGFGIQVKNYSIDEQAMMTRAGIEVHQQPVDVAHYFGDSQSFLGFMANYFFNTSIQEHGSFVSMDELCHYLAENMQGEMLRLAVADIDDTISFYNIGQQFFVPGSALLSMYLTAGHKLKVSISNNGGAKWTGGVSRGPNEYWELRNRVWYPTEKNISAFNAAINNNISITTHMGKFDLSSFAY